MQSITYGRKTSSSQSRRSLSFCLSYVADGYSLLMILLLVITVGVLVILYVIKTEETHRLKNILKINDDILLKERRRTNQTIYQLDSLVSERNITIQQLTRQLELKQRRGSKINRSLFYNVSEEVTIQLF